LFLVSPFAVFATVGYMYAYKVGIWKPDSATQQAIYEIRDRADRISAAEIATQAKVILDKSEAERKLDIEALTKAVQAGPPK